MQQNHVTKKSLDCVEAVTATSRTTVGQVSISMPELQLPPCNISWSNTNL